MRDVAQSSDSRLLWSGLRESAKPLIKGHILESMEISTDRLNLYLWSDFCLFWDLSKRNRLSPRQTPSSVGACHFRFPSNLPQSRFQKTRFTCGSLMHRHSQRNQFPYDEKKYSVREALSEIQGDAVPSSFHIASPTQWRDGDTLLGHLLKSLDLDKKLTYILNMLSGSRLLTPFVTGPCLLGYFLLPREIAVERDSNIFLVRRQREIWRSVGLGSVC